MILTISCTNKKGETAPSKSPGGSPSTSTPLAAPEVTIPASNPYLSSDTNITISGTCQNGATVQLTGSDSDSVVCASGTYSFSISQSTDATYNFSISQSDTQGNTSTSTSFQWTRDSNIPATPVLTSPSLVTYSSSGNSLVISGSCNSGNPVELSGSSSDTVFCNSDTFSFTVNNNTDGTYNYSIRQKSSINVYSGSATLTWIRDTVAPAVLVLTSPASNPYVSATSNLTMSGACDNGGTIYVTGSTSTNTGCVSGAFSLNVTKSSDGNYSFNVLQKDAAGNSSPSMTLAWTRDTSSPPTPTIASPTSPYTSNAGSITITGGCQSQSTVQLTGDGSTSATCVLSNYSLSVSKSSDGIYNFNISQIDLAGNSSASISFVWQKDTVAPSPVGIINPALNPFTSSGSDITISGSCESGASVSLSGADSQTITCTADSYLFASSKSSDGSYNYSLSQTDIAGNASTPTVFTWVRNSTVPGTPTIDSPTTRPFSSNLNSLAISGTCDSGNTVEMSGYSSASTACVSNAYTFNVSASTDGVYDYTIKQKTPADVYSAGIGIQWTRDTVAPSVPGITSPTTNPKYSNGNSLIISGTCESGSTVNIAGATSSTTACASNNFNFVISKSVDGTYTFSITQTDLATNISAAISTTWIRDTIAPAMLSLASPTTNPLVSGDTNITISGGCEPSAALSMTGAASASATCSALGQYTFNISKTSDGVYDFSIVQTDLAGNSSSTLGFQWRRDTSVPSTPVIAAPASNPFYSNQNSLSIEASCDSSLTPSKAIVSLSGDVTAGEVISPAGSLTQVCNSSPVTFVIQKSTDASFNFSVSQENPNAGTSSSAADIQWIRDTVTPSIPTITAPASNPFTAPGNLTLSGSCEPNATVYLTGADTQNISCNGSGTYSFSVVKSTDSTYNFGLFQTDLAGNSTSTQSFQWIRDINSLQPPVITTPSVSPITSNSSSFIISGTCSSGYLLTLSGNVIASEVTTPANSLTQTCVGGTFSYIINVSSDGTRNFNLTQTFNAVTSAAVTIQWLRDTVIPVTTLSSTPNNPNLSTGGSFVFSSNESGSTFECKLDSATYASCTSPLNEPSFTNGSRTFYVRSIDSAGNVSTAQSYAWTQAAYNTVALYHLDTSSLLSDESFYTQNSVVNQNLTSTGTTTNDTSGTFNNSRGFGSNIYLSTASTDILNNAVGTVTIEGFFKMSTAIATTGQYYTLLAKSGSASPQLGWEIRLKKATSSKYVIDFVSSQTGTSSATVSTSNLTVSTGNWYYFSVTWNKGQTKIYFNSTTAKVTSGTVGTSALFASTAALTLGKGPGTGTGSALWFAGSLDEIRISQVVRAISIPTAPFNED